MAKPTFAVRSFPLYVSNWRDSETRMRLNAAERGIFWELIFFCYKDGNLPTDKATLAKIADVSLREFDRCWPNLKKSFYERDGRLHHRKVDEVLPGLEKAYDQKRRAGRKSGDARSGKGGTDDEQPLNGRSPHGGTAVEQIKIQLEQELQPEIELQPDSLARELSDRHRKKGDRGLVETALVSFLVGLDQQQQNKLLSLINRRHEAWCSVVWASVVDVKFIPKLSNWLRDGGWLDDPGSGDDPPPSDLPMWRPGDPSPND